MPGHVTTIDDTRAASQRESAGGLPPVAGCAADKTLVVDLRRDAIEGDLVGQAFLRLVLLLPTRPTKSLAEIVDRCVSSARQNAACRVCLVSSFRVHFGDYAMSALEESIRARFQDAGLDTVVLRAGHVIDRDPGARSGWARLAPWYPLVPASVVSVFLDRKELDSAIDRVCGSQSRVHHRRLTLLGRRRPLRDVLIELVRPGMLTSCLTAVARVLSWLQIGRIAGLVLSGLARYDPVPKCWHVATLKPNTVRELLSLYNPLNQRHVAIAGYNTGVTHFGWKYPDRAVVSTVASGRLVRVGNRTVTVDAGVLLKQVIGQLRARGKELYVVPNYSYISMGTTFMVPVHGSGSEISTLGDSIEQALVYDVAVDRIFSIRRGDERFGRYMYNPPSGILVLRLRLRIRDKARYFLRRSRLQSPSAADIWHTFRDPAASNIELRKSRAADDFVDVAKYDTTPSDDRESLEIPRDSIGRVWDRLEENPVTSWLFHTYVRNCGYHVELFLNEPEFEIFWEAHKALPLSKLQLRLVKCDGLSHSPFGDCDRISVDIFMKRRNSAAFVSFMKEHLPHARFNPGKHSM
jgi:hypothetical protein